MVVGDVASTWVNHVMLFTIDLADPQNIRIAGQAEVPFDYANLVKVEANRAFLATYHGVFSYLVEDISQPTFEEFFRTQGWVQDVLVRGDRAYVPSGYYGVQVRELGSN